MSTEMPSDNWPVVLDVFRDIQFLRLIDPPENAPPCNPNQPSSSSFLLDFKVIIRRVTSDEADRLIEDDDIMPRNIFNEASIGIDLIHTPHTRETLFETLRQLQVPTEERRGIVEAIIFKASEKARETGATTKRIHMLVDIDFYAVVDDEEEEENGAVNIGGDYYYGPRFVPATTSSISKLKRKRVGVESEVCAVCLDEMTVGIEATTMPCGHFYHEACIVGWLKQSGVCPLCKFRMPENEDGVNYLSLGDM